MQSKPAEPPQASNGHHSNGNAHAAPKEAEQTRAPTRWDCISHVALLILAMREEAAAEAVFSRFPGLPIPDPHGAAMFAALKLALESKKKHGQDHSERAALILLKQSSDSETATETSEIFENTVLKAAPSKDARRVAMRAAQVLHRLENPVFPLTDAGNGERLTFHHYSSAVYCVEWKKWLLWNSQRWEVDTRNAIFVLAKETARKIPEEAKSAKGEDYAATLKWAIKSEAKERLNAMIFLASTEDGMSIEAGELDRNKWLFNVPNGTLDLKIGGLKPHDRADLLTKISPVNFDPHATCPLFLEFLHKIFRGRVNLIRFMQRVIGYSLTGETREQLFLVLHGDGSNGKGVLLKILLEIFGDYGSTIDPKTLYVKHTEGMATDIAELAGKRFLAGSEGNEGKRLDEALIKRMTGDGDQLTGERKFENPFTFTPQFQIFFATNHAPEIRGTDHAIWRRVQKVPFEVEFWNAEKGESGPPELQADTALFEKLRAEMPGILAWAVRGCLEWQRDGLGTPTEVLEATKTYRDEQDKLREFFIERCVEHPAATVNASELFKAYEKWVDENNEAKISSIAFGKRMQERGFSHHRQAGTGRKFWQGVGLKEV
jgi:putative DNA primase/helicase